MSASKFGSGLSDLLETSFFRQVGHSLLLNKKRGKKMKKQCQYLWANNKIIHLVGSYLYSNTFTKSQKFKLINLNFFEGKQDFENLRHSTLFANREKCEYFPMIIYIQST